jgi:hypothetical protein
MVMVIRRRKIEHAVLRNVRQCIWHIVAEERPEEPSSGMSVTFYQTIRRHIREDSNLHSHRRQNYKSPIGETSFKSISEELKCALMMIFEQRCRVQYRLQTDWSYSPGLMSGI